MRRRTLVLWAALALLWANLPYLLGYLTSTPQHHFGGFFLYEQDGYSYLAKMRQGAQGAWAFHLPYTSEDEYQSGSAVYLFYLALGKLPFDPALIYHAARVLGSLGLLWLLYRFLARFIRDRRRLLMTWWLMLFSGGWGLLASYLIDQKYVAYELIAPDATLFSILYGPPHIIFGYALLLIWIIYTLDSFQTDRSQLPQRLIVVNAIGGLTAVTREAYAPAFAAIFGAYLIALWIQRRTIPWREVLIVALSSIAAGGYGLYLVSAFRTIPGLIAWSQQNPFVSPNPIDFILGFAPLLVLAAIGIRLAITHQPSAQSSSLTPALRAGASVPHPSSLLFAWLVAGPIMAYLPIEISRRLIAGWQIPLCVLAAYGLLRLFETRRVLGALVLASVVPTTLLIILGGVGRVSALQPPLFITADQRAALDWLGAHSTDRDVVFSDWHFGNLVPIYADARVFVGHPIETIDFKHKTALVQHFFDQTLAASERADLLARWHITLIVAEADQSLVDWPIVFQPGAYTIYRPAP